MDLFSFDKARIKLNKKEPLRLFETFSGYGSQAMALKRMGVEVNSVGISDWWIPAIIAYGEVHTEVDKELKDRIKTFDKDQIIDILLKFKLSFNDKTIATRLNYERKNIKELRRILYYNTISKNYGNIENVKGFDVDAVDVFTFSFPCQDLSKAGQQKGLSNETRSGLVYEVLRILNELKVGGGLMPNVLLMENVPDLLSQKFKDGWHEIYNEIESLGYTNHAFFLNAKDFGVAQNRNRVFMVSIYGDYAYNIPRTKPLVKRLKDYLEDEVDEKYYLSDKIIYNTYTSYVGGYNRKKKFISGVNEKEISKTMTTKLDRPESSYIIEPFDKIIDENDLENVGGVVIPEATKQGYAIAKDGDGVYINRPHQKRGVVQKGMIQTLKTSGNDVGVVVKDERDILGIYNYGASDNFMQGRDRFKEDVDVFGTIETKLKTGVVVKTHNKDGVVWKTQDNDMPRHRIYNNNNKVGFTITTVQEQQPAILETEKLRIRKLTPREALRLMDVSESDIDKILKVSSNTAAYKLAGNSIVVNVLVEIFKKLF